MKVRVCFGNHKGLAYLWGHFIRKFNNFPASHTWVEIENEHSCFVYEAVWPKSRRINKLNHHYKTLYEFPFELGEHEQYYARNVLGRMTRKPYSIFQLFVILLQLIRKGFTRHITIKYVNGKQRLICTELSARFLSEVKGYSFSESPDTIDLNELFAKLCKEQNKPWL